MRPGFLQNGAVHMLAGFLAMGGWAVFANAAHPMPRPLIAGLVQGAISAIITLFLKRMIEGIAARLHGVAALLVPPLIAALTSFLLLFTIHKLAHTPELALTIALPLTVSAGYAFLYSVILWRS